VAGPQWKYAMQVNVKIASLVFVFAAAVTSQAQQAPAPGAQKPVTTPQKPVTTPQKPATTPQTPAAAPQVPQKPEPAPQNGGTAKPPAGVNIPAGVATPADYVIGPEDVLAVVFWREKDLSGEVAVRPDGKITLPLLNDVHAAGLTPEQLRDVLTKGAEKFVEVPSVTVVVKAINSRKVYVTGNVGKSGFYPLTAPTTVMQMIAMAGGLQEFADSKNISILRNENGREVAFRFNYNDVKKRKNLKQNIQLKPGDTIIVP
jgi:polysaccharide biosynthesis/export protein